jgi:hypothetical protein
MPANSAIWKTVRTHRVLLHGLLSVKDMPMRRQ